MPMDIAGYPHILDLIVSHSPSHSLVALRGVSREIHARADALLFAHLAVIFPPTDAGYISIRSASAPVTLRWLRYGTGNKSRDQRRHRARKHVHHLVEAARYIDGLLEGWVNAPASAQKALFKSTLKLGPDTTFRILGSVPEWSRCHSRAAAEWCNSLLRERRLIVLPESNFLPATPVQLACSRLSSPGLYCFHTCSDVVRGDLDVPIPERVLHFLWDQEYDPMLDVPPWQRALYGLVDTIRLNRLDDANPEAKITVVGGGEGVRAVLGLARHAPQEEFEAAVDDLAALPSYGRTVGVGTDDADRVWQDRRTKCIRFVTPEEYVELVGAEQATLETQSDPSATSPAKYLL